MRPAAFRFLAGTVVAAAVLSGCDLDALSKDEPPLEAPPTELEDAYPNALAVGDTAA